MINLLPPQIKENNFNKIRNGQIFKMFLALLLIFVLLNGLAWLGGNLFGIRLKIFQSQIQNLEKELKSYEEIEKKALGIKERLNKAEVLEKETKSYSDIVQAIAGLTPEGTQLQAVSMSEKELNISGQAASEEEVVKFQRSLERDKLFSNVYIQSSSLTSEESGTSIKFSLKVSLK